MDKGERLKFIASYVCVSETVSDWEKKGEMRSIPFVINMVINVRLILAN